MNLLPFRREIFSFRLLPASPEVNRILLHGFFSTISPTRVYVNHAQTMFRRGILTQHNIPLVNHEICGTRYSKVV